MDGFKDEMGRRCAAFLWGLGIIIVLLILWSFFG